MTDFGGDQQLVEIDPEAENRISVPHSIKLKADVKLITVKKVHSGAIYLTSSEILFDGKVKCINIRLQDIKYIFFRKYLHSDTAIEIFTFSMKSFFFDFVVNQRKNFMQLISNMRLNSEFIQTSSSSIDQLIEKAKQQWVHKQISNFDYLMKLNIYAGRSFNDLSQYPVFPWILSDYTSEKLDLTNPESFRDLSCPIGAIPTSRYDVLLERMKTQTAENRFLYSSCYSSGAVVIGYLIRSEPFASLHVELQSGKFDFPERLFASIPKAWESVGNNQMDYRELIPEFFYLPDFLKNSNEYDLGYSEGDVALPKWANTPEDFIRIHSEALESDYVSKNLHHWIDLIFGSNSRGQKALEANNLFAPHFYDTNITLESDPNFIKEFAICFGQIPRQLFTDPHPQQLNIHTKPKTITSILSTLQNAPIIFVGIFNGSPISLDINFVLRFLKISGSSIKETNNSSLNLPIKLNTSLPVAVQNDFLIYALPFDQCFEIYSLLTSKVIQTKRLQISKITCISCSKQFCVTGSQDSSVVVWRDNSFNDTTNVQPCYIITKHSRAISCLAFNIDCDLIVTCSIDGTVALTNLFDGSFVMLKQFPHSSYKVFVSSTNIFIAFDNHPNYNISVFDLNLNLFHTYSLSSKISSWAFNGCTIFYGNQEKNIIGVEFPSFQEIFRKCYRAVCNSMACNENYIVCGFESGEYGLIEILE